MDPTNLQEECYIEKLLPKMSRVKGRIHTAEKFAFCVGVSGWSMV